MLFYKAPVKCRGFLFFCFVSLASYYTPLVKEPILSKLATDAGDRAIADSKTLCTIVKAYA